ncbi:MAG: hypothetical protein AB7O28_13980 [Vicinamibacterales bacterium]
MAGHVIVVGLSEVLEARDGLSLYDCAPCTRLVVRTANTSYRVEIARPPELRIQGGAFFPRPEVAWLVGACDVPGGPVKSGWIGVGLRIDLRCRGHHIVTSPVRYIEIEQAG